MIVKAVFVVVCVALSQAAFAGGPGKGPYSAVMTAKDAVLLPDGSIRIIEPRAESEGWIREIAVDPQREAADGICKAFGMSRTVGFSADLTRDYRALVVLGEQGEVVELRSWHLSSNSETVCEPDGRGGVQCESVSAPGVVRSYTTVTCAD